MPAISATTWEDDVAIEVDEEMVNEIKTALANEEDPEWSCINCHRSLKPWRGDDVYIVRKHLEEDHSLPSETGSKRNPSAVMRSLILEFYERKCFGCGVAASRSRLTIDHIVPRSRGGDAAFRNLQPLCEECQQKKSDQMGEEIEVHDNMYFRLPPGESYDDLFW